MKYRITIDDETYDVEVGDLDSRPVIATIGGESFEVWPEAVSAVPTAAQNGTAKSVSALIQPPQLRTPKNVTVNSAMVNAPIPGVIDSVSVQPGDKVEVGQQLCVLEAMKMKNIIRATRAGIVAAVHVSAGQQVKHHDPLIEFGA